MSLFLGNVSPRFHTPEPEQYLQHPLQIAMEISIHTLHVSKSHLLSQDHLVKGANEKCIQEPPVENGQTNNASDEFEIVEMLGINARVRVDLQGVVVVGGVFEEAVEGVEHFMRKQEEELAGKTSVI